MPRHSLVCLDLGAIVSSSVQCLARGDCAQIVVFFSNCPVEANPQSEARVDFEMRRPSGSIYEARKALLKYGAPANTKGPLVALDKGVHGQDLQQSLASA